jgi:hypothetical protein
MNSFTYWRTGAQTLAGCFLLSLICPAFGEARVSSLADMIAGTSIPHTIKLKELSPDWQRVTVAGEMMLGMGGMMQSSMQMLGSMFGGGGASNDAIYTRGASIKIADQEYLIGYRLPSQGVDLGAMMAMGGAAPGAPGAAPKVPKRPPVTPETDLSLVLINLRAIASFSDIHPFDMAEAMKPGPPGLLENLFNKSKEKAEATSATANMKQLAAGIMMYCQDWDETLPAMRDAASLKQAIEPYVRNESAFRSPATGQAFQPNVHLSGRRLKQLPLPASVVMLYSAVPEPDGSRVVARADGAVRTVRPDEWKQLAESQRLPER